MIAAWQLVSVALVAIFLHYLIRRWLKIQNARNKLASWMPSLPRVPILGSIEAFKGGSAGMISNIARMTNNPCKSSYFEVLGTWGIVTRDYDFLEFVLSSNTILSKSEDYDSFVPWLGNGLLIAKGQKWKNHRRIITPAFHFSILEQFVNIFDASENIMIEKLKREALNKDSFDIFGYITNCALDIICESAMGLNINCQEGENQEYVQAVKTMCRIVTDRGLSVWKNVDFLFRLSSDYKKQCQVVKILHGFTNSVIEKKRKELANRNNDANSETDDLGRKKKKAFLDLLLDVTIDGRPLSDEEIREEVDTFMFAGHDTTSAAIVAAIFVLSEHPEIQKLIRDELQSVFGLDRTKPLTYQHLQDLKYLDLVVKEVLRLYPSAPFISRRTESDVEFKGNIIPENTILSLSLIGINRDPDLYDDPETFKPERWLENGATKKPYAYLPFSAGPRNCIGQKYALLELKTMISKMLMHFDILPTDPPHKLVISSEVVLKFVTGVYIKLRECEWNKS